MTDISVKSLINGVAADYLNIHDRAIHYGDGIFETILCHNNKLYYWQQHYQRLLESANKLQFVCPDAQTLLDDIAYLLAENKSSDNLTFVLKIILTRGSSERGYVFAKNADINRLVLLSTLDSNYSPLLTGQLSTGELFVCKQQVSINENLAGLKHLNRLENVLARSEWNSRGDSGNNNKFVDGLMLNANQHVIEGTMSNLFAIKDNQLFTPDLGQSGVKGIMREVIINMAKKNNIQHSVVNIRLDELLHMDALFITNSLIGMKSINKLGSSLYKEMTTTNRIFKTLLNTRDGYAQTV